LEIDRESRVSAVNPELEVKIGAVAVELGVNQVDLVERMKDAVTRGIDPDATAMFHMTEDDIIDVHGRISFALRMAGLKGAALDEACAAAFREAARAIERERGIEWKRERVVRLVG
jgi:hypothetical protein